MEAFVHNGDFDFGVFGNVVSEPEPRVQGGEKKRKGRDQEEKRSNTKENQQNQPHAKRQHTDKQDNNERPKGGSKKGYTKDNNQEHGNEEYNKNEEEGDNQGFNNKGKQNQRNNNKAHTNNTTNDNKAQHDNKGNNNKDNTNGKGFDNKANNKKEITPQSFASKEAWEPDASDIANTIKVEKGESIFLGEFSDTGLSDRIVSTITNSMKMPNPTVIQHHAIPQILQGHDALIKAETGSGKTLTYLLPLVDVLGKMTPHIKREVGAYAIILVPTRELVSQVYDVVMRVAKTYIWVVPGLLSGGENKSTEKARLRRGVNILVSTPGRLMDHLQTTASFKYHQLRFLVLDEADRLLDMGLGPQVAEIVQFLKDQCSDRYSDQSTSQHNRRVPGTHLNKPAAGQEKEEEKKEEKPKLNKTIKFTYDDGYEAPKPIVLQGKKFQTILASATLHNGIRQLAFVALHKPVYVGLVPLAVAVPNKKKRDDIEKGQTYHTPTNLQQYYALVRTKDRPSSLAMFLQERIKEDTKAIIFVASCAAVNFFFHVFSEATADDSVIAPKKRQDSKVAPISSEKKEVEFKPLVNAPIFRLHGDLTQLDRHQATTKFRNSKNGIMFATDVAARGLDFPDLDWIIQFDPPADTKDYIHRVGRTARIGRKGQSLLYITPEEKEYLEYLKGFGIELEPMRLPGDITTQRLIEQYVRHDSHAYITAKNAYIAAVRAYATHTSATKHIFNVANLHVGHLAMAYCLHDRPMFLKSAAANERAAREREKEKVKHDRETEKAYRNSHKKHAKSEFDAGF